MWMDSDASFVDFINKSIFSLIKNSDSNMWISKDSPRWDGEFNAGAFVVKNNYMGSKIMSVWKSYYNPAHWDKKNDNWASSGNWAGSTYEQGAFIEHIIPAKDVFKIKQLPYYILNENDCSNPHIDAIVYHFAGDYKLVSAETCSSILSNKEIYINSR